MTKSSFSNIQSEYLALIDHNKCVRCKRCIQNCGWGTYSFGGDKKELYTALRQIYGSALLNGPFAIVFGYSKGMVAMNDRIKLRPLVAAAMGDFTYVASEEAAIRAVCPSPDIVWSPKAGEPVMVEFEEKLQQKAQKGGLISL